MFSSAANRTRPLISPVRAEVKRVSRKDDEVASGNLLIYYLHTEDSEDSSCDSIEFLLVFVLLVSFAGVLAFLI